MINLGKLFNPQSRAWKKQVVKDCREFCGRARREIAQAARLYMQDGNQVAVLRVFRPLYSEAKIHIKLLLRSYIPGAKRFPDKKSKPKVYKIKHRK